MNCNYLRFLMSIGGLLFLFASAKAQVSGISYTLSPAAEYVKWNDRAGLDNGYLYGGKLGIGFGEFFELRGSYMRSLNLQTNFNNFGFTNFDETTFTPRDIQLTRWGGELKANISQGKLLPFLTLGTGVQSLELDSLTTNKRIYVQVGAGIKLSAGDRYTITLEAKNTTYNFNAANRFLTEQDRIGFGAVEDDMLVERLRNWSFGASLQFYIGGRRPGQLSALDKAYFSSFSTGLKGLGVPIEPTLVKMNFNDALPYKDTWMAGGYAGFDFGPYVGVRGFYFQAMDDNKINTSFDKLAMYGGEIRMNMNASKGTIPYLIAGGGYININEEEYIGREEVEMTPESQAFVMGGGGLIFPLNKRLKLFGSVRTLLTSNTKLDDLQEVDELNTSWMYSFGVNLTLGRKAANPNALAQATIDTNEALLKATYETKILELEQQLNQAYAEQDIEQAAEILRQKDQAEQVVEDLDQRDNATRRNQQQMIDFLPSNSRLQMSPAEFQLLIEEILENMGTGGQRIAPAVGQQLGGSTQDMQSLLKQQEMEKQMSEIEKLLIQMNERAVSKADTEKEAQTRAREEMRRDLTEFSSLLMVELQRLNEKVHQNNLEIRQNTQEVRTIKQGSNGNGSSSVTPIIENTPAGQVPAGIPAMGSGTATAFPSTGLPTVRTSGQFLANSKAASQLSYQGMAGIAGFNLGGNPTANVGLRWYYKFGTSKIELMPEAFFGFGTPANFGISVNGILPFTIAKLGPIKPYIGAGAGLMQIGENGDNRLKTSLNILVGSYVNVAGGRMFVDLTGRNLFKYNQVIAGYRFAF